MRKFFVLALVLIVTLLASCSTTQSDESIWYLGAGMLPVKEVEVSNEWLQSDLFEVLGTFTGSANVVVDDKDNYLANTYGSLTSDEISLMMTNVRTISKDPFALALSAAMDEMNKKAVASGASFVVFPNYFVENNEGTLKVTVNAIGVKLTEGKHYPNPKADK